MFIAIYALPLGTISHLYFQIVFSVSLIMLIGNNYQYIELSEMDELI